MRVMLLALVLSGCTASFQPFPSVSKAEITAELKTQNENILMLANEVNKIRKELDEAKGKK